LVAKAGLPLALLFILAACGGSTQPEPVSARAVAGRGFTVSVPAGWNVRKTSKTLVATRGGGLVSVTRYTLLKPYEAAKFAAAAKELDGVAAELATRNGGKVTKRETVEVAGRRIRAYTIESSGAATMRIGFVLVDKSEYQLVCSGDTATACDLLFSTFALG
jgi:poly(3-hydroxybutyrate) depolymerase